MAKHLRTDVIINASPARVWDILVDFQNYPHWNPFIKSLKGTSEIGKKIDVTIEPPGTKAMRFQPTLLVFEKNQELKWLGKGGIKGIFDGEHRFQLIDNGNGTTTFIQSERFQGILVPFFKKMLDINTVKGFELMNLKLKERAEKS